MEELESLAARRRLSAAETRAERGAAARLRLDYRAAADHYAEAATIVPATDREARWWFRMEQGSALYDQGAEFGDNPALNQAIAAYGLALGLVSRAKQPSDWALTQTDLGGALRLLGEREAGTARLEEAAEAFRAALGELSRERAPLAWAVIQSKLGGALLALGEREAGTTRLEEAVTAYRQVLAVFEQAEASYYVKLAQHNLALANDLLAKRRGAG